MFCARCGQQIPEASEVCPLCGQQTTLKLDPIPAVAPALAQPRSPYAFVTIPQDLGPRGVGGWLLFYCIGLTILAPGVTLLQLSFLLRLMKLGNYEYLLEFSRVFYGLVVGIFLWMKRPLALFLLRVYFIAVAAILLLTGLRLIAVALRPHSPLALVREITALIAQTIIPALWFAYFHKSERVRNTYGANL